MTGRFGDPGDLNLNPAPRCAPGNLSGLDPDTTTLDKQTQTQSSNCQDCRSQSQLLARVVGELKRGPALISGEFDASRALRQRPPLPNPQRIEPELGHVLNVEGVNALRHTVV